MSKTWAAIATILVASSPARAHANEVELVASPIRLEPATHGEIVRVDAGGLARVVSIRGESPTSCPGRCVLSLGHGRWHFAVQSWPFEPQRDVDVAGPTDIRLRRFRGGLFGGGIVLTVLGATATGFGILFAALVAQWGVGSTGPGAVYASVASFAGGAGLIASGIPMIVVALPRIDANRSVSITPLAGPVGTSAWAFGFRAVF